MFQLERDNRSIFKIIGGIRSASYGGLLFLLLDIRCRRHQPGSLKLKASLTLPKSSLSTSSAGHSTEALLPVCPPNTAGLSSPSVPDSPPSPTTVVRHFL